MLYKLQVARLQLGKLLAHRHHRAFRRGDSQLWRNRRTFRRRGGTPAPGEDALRHGPRILRRLGARSWIVYDGNQLTALERLQQMSDAAIGKLPALDHSTARALAVLVNRDGALGGAGGALPRGLCPGETGPE